ncbi:MAG: DUF721 domain-containing protein [Alcanivorax sp.]
MRPVSEATSRVAAKNFSRKYIALGRLVNQWTEIMGEEFAAKAQPIKINYRKKRKDQKPYATLDIGTTASNATILNYQKGVILERLNTLFGDTWIKDIRFVITEAVSDEQVYMSKRKTPLAMKDKKYLAEVLDQIDDPDIKEKLESLGKSLLADKKNES